MAGRPPEVDHVKATFLSEIKAAEELVNKIRQFSGGINPAGTPGLHPKYVSQVIELAFMGVVASWEEFLEMTMVRYVAGAKTKAGYAPTPKFGRATSIDHAYKVLSHNPNFNPAKNYLKSTDPKWVTTSADFIFSDHGFADIKTKESFLHHASAIRNRVAHSSAKCKAEFKATALHFLAPVNGQLTQGYGPGDLLMAPVVKHFSQLTIQSGKNHFSAYADLFRALASKVVP